MIFQFQVRDIANSKVQGILHHNKSTIQTLSTLFFNECSQFLHKVSKFSTINKNEETAVEFYENAQSSPEDRSAAIIFLIFFYVLAHQDLPSLFIAIIESDHFGLISRFIMNLHGCFLLDINFKLISPKQYYRMPILLA